MWRLPRLLRFWTALASRSPGPEYNRSGAVCATAKFAKLTVIFQYIPNLVHCSVLAEKDAVNVSSSNSNSSPHCQSSLGHQVCLSLDRFLTTRHEDCSSGRHGVRNGPRLKRICFESQCFTASSNHCDRLTSACWIRSFPDLGHNSCFQLTNALLTTWNAEELIGNVMFNKGGSGRLCEFDSDTKLHTTAESGCDAARFHICLKVCLKLFQDLCRC